ncbi:unnamed protein product, partial [Durusdinium trenchii]
CFLCQLACTAIQWHTIWDLHEWINAPCELVLLSNSGPLAFKQSGQACSLLEALCLNGVYLTAGHIRKLLWSLGAQVPANLSAKQLVTFLFTVVLGSDQDKTQQATHAYQEQQEGQANKLEQELDSEMEEILECHKDDNYNT